MVGRSCSQCYNTFDREAFSNNQWAKGVGVSRCQACVHGEGGSRSSSSMASQTRRTNNAHSASFDVYDLDHPFASGAFRWVAEGRYTSGERDGEKCVCKW